MLLGFPAVLEKLVGIPWGMGGTQKILEAAGNFTADWMSFGVPRSLLT